MSAEFYLFLPEKSSDSVDLNSVELSWVYEDVNKDFKLAQGLLKDAAVAALNQHIIIVVPGEDVLFLCAEIPGKNLQHIQQAVPYVLEDSVIDDVDDLHFAIAKTRASKENNSDASNQYNVAVINKHYFEYVLAQLEKSGIHADAMITDYSLLEQNTLFFDGKKILFNGAKLKFSSLIEGEINLDYFDFAENKIDKLIYLSADADTEFQQNLNTLSDKLKTDTDIYKEQCDIHPSLFLVKNKPDEKSVNLLQGFYKKKKNWSKAGKTWFPAAALFLVWVSVQGILFVVDYIRVSNQNKVLDAKITKIYKNTFPTSRRADNAKVRMESKLLSLKKRKGQSGRGFTEMLSASAAIFSRTKGLKIKSLRYYDGRINLELQIASLQALDKLKNQLNKEKGYQVEIQNASSGKENVTARIQIMGAGS